MGEVKSGHLAEYKYCDIDEMVEKAMRGFADICR